MLLGRALNKRDVSYKNDTVKSPKMSFLREELLGFILFSTQKTIKTESNKDKA